MSWTTLYILGRNGFKEAVLLKLKMTWLQGSEGDSNLLMFWLPHPKELRGLKKTIGSKLILRYRIQFFTDLNIHLDKINVRSTAFSVDEAKLIESGVQWDITQRASRLKDRSPKKAVTADKE